MENKVFIIWVIFPDSVRRETETRGPFVLEEPRMKDQMEVRMKGGHGPLIATPALLNMSHYHSVKAIRNPLRI